MEELPYLLFCISFNFASWSILIILMTYQPIIMETSAVMTDKSALISDVKERLQDIYLEISWKELKRVNLCHRFNIRYMALMEMVELEDLHLRK